MAVPEMTWKRQEVTVSEDSPLRSIALGPAPAPGAGGGGSSTVEILLPNFDGLSTPEAKIELLLVKAAEVEHALMVQYLYSAYSLKGTSTVAAEQADLTAWRASILTIARQEMGHLMSVENLRLLLNLEPSFARDDFPMVSRLFPFPFDLHPLDRKTLARYVVSESPVGAQGIEDIIDQAMGPGGQAVNHVGVLYGLIGVLLAEDLAEIEEAAKGGDFWDRFVRDIAYLAYLQHPPSSGWHLPDSAFKAESIARQATQDDWAPNSPDNVQIATLKGREDARRAIKDIGVQGEGPGQAAGGDSHFDRFLNIYRGQTGMTRPFPDAQWVPTLAVPIGPKVSDSAEPGAISNPTTQPYARLANLRYAILLGFLEEYLRKDPVADRSFLKAAALKEMTVNLRRLSVKLVGLPRTTAGAGAGVAALPFEMPTDGFPLPEAPAARKAVHAGRLQRAIDLESQTLQGEGVPFDPLLSPMRTADQQNLTLFTVASPTMPNPTTPPPATPAPATTTHWPQVKAILAGLITDWITDNGMQPNLTGKHDDPHFGWATKDQLINSKPKGLQLIQPGVAGKDTNLVRALREGFPPSPQIPNGYPQMPNGGPYLTDPDPKYAGQLDYIIKWIDEGMPD